MNFRLDYEDGDFVLVFPLPIQESRRVDAYNSEFRKAIEQYHIYPERFDEVLYPKFRIYYQKIAGFFNINSDKLTRISRHHFFVATEPIEYNNNLIPGLSYLQQLLGYNYPSPTLETKDIEGQTLITTGDPNLDIVADALLIFKVAGLENYYSLNELSKLCKQANDRLKQAEDSARGENKSGDENLASEIIDEDFAKHKARLYNWLINLGVDVPQGF